MALLSRDGQERLVTVVRHALLLVWTAIALFPLYWMFAMATRPVQQSLELPPTWIFVPTLQNFAMLTERGDFLQGLQNSLIIVSGSVVLVLMIGVPAAYAVSRYDIPRERDVLVWILSSRMLPPVAVMIPFLLIFQQFDLFDTIPGMILIYGTINISIVVWVMKAFFDGIPESLEEAAMVDGATRSQALRKVILPAALPGIIAVAIISFIFAWIELLFALVLTSTNAITAPMTVYQFIGTRRIEWGMLAAASVVVVLPILFGLIAVNKYLASGLSFGVVLKE
jgi:multiple sugar transport system permease protein